MQTQRSQTGLEPRMQLPGNRCLAVYHGTEVIRRQMMNRISETLGEENAQENAQEAQEAEPEDEPEDEPKRKKICLKKYSH